MSYSARLSSFHTVSPEFNPFTVYVITVRKSGQPQWQVFRRYREWEDLRAKLERQVGSAPPMPKKNLFGRMRPDVIEPRVRRVGDAELRESEVGGAADASPVGERQQMLHQLIQSAQSNFILSLIHI